MKGCLICGSGIEPFISFGQMPIANGFLTPEEFESEHFYELEVAFCPTCTMVQLVEQPAREMMFHEDYAFFSSTSRRQVAHFKEFAELVIKNYLNSADPFVVEIGSNDGIMLHKEIDMRELYECYYMHHYYTYADDLFLNSHRKFLKDVEPKEQNGPAAYEYFLNQLTEAKHNQIIENIDNYIDSGKRYYFRYGPE